MTKKKKLWHLQNLRNNMNSFHHNTTRIIFTKFVSFDVDTRTLDSKNHVVGNRISILTWRKE